MIYPLAVGGISAVFAGVVLGQYGQRRRPYQLVWAIALLMSALASAGYVLALPPNSSQSGFRLYYALGGMLMPAWLGLGSLFLVASRRLAEMALALLVNTSALGVGAISAAPLNAEALAQLNGRPGTGVLEPGAWLPLTIILNTVGVAAVVGVAIYTALRRRHLLGANVLIAAGDLVIGAAGAMARTGKPELFWATMLAGWIVIFAGFLMASAAPSTEGSRLDSGRNSRSQLAVPAGRTPAA